MAAKTGIYEPLLPPFHEVSDTVQGPYALLAAVIMIVLSGLVVAAKLHTTVSLFRKLRKNDLVIIVALVQGLLNSWPAPLLMHPGICYRLHDCNM